MRLVSLKSRGKCLSFHPPPLDIIEYNFRPG
jgi:hypothetical protein